ncbi:hypothetical protein PIROE2DRAFT_15568 [Piromyces sp. E2]|nr:hypothetical protein PIROE2DRAFT_15568 [Piromyces sp. E2]|eukprot:OUM59026.1 hypothetical protein PIROE2DRAFT_15568 [Piromyces sp. E2]
MTEFIVDTKYGKVQGFENKGQRQWFGVPYAKPPVGDLRFRRAVECESWEGVKDCTKRRGRPIQFKYPSSLSSKNDSEDCLYLYIWRKSTINEKNLPVNVWFHGGYLHCSSAIDTPCSESDGNQFAESGILFISVDYRIGPLGCYDFSIYDKNEFDSNCTLSDQIMALKWINENIEAFGGDPHNITIHGESSGGASVLALMCSPATKGLYQKVICQSGYPDGIHSTRSNKLLMDMFLDHLKIKPEEVKKIRDLDTKSLQSAVEYVFKNLSKYPGIFWPGFVYDDLLPDNCYDSLKNGIADGVKLLIGINKNEGTMFKTYHECPKSKEEIQKMFENNDMSDKFRLIEEFYYEEKKGGGDTAPECNFDTDYLFLLGTHEIADIQSQNNDVYMYRFDFVTPLMKLSGHKAAHGLDLSPVFKVHDFSNQMLYFLTKSKYKQILEQYMHGSWVNFMKTGNPNGEHLTISWDKYDKESKSTMIFDKAITIINNPAKETLEFWKSQIKIHRFYQ